MIPRGHSCYDIGLGLSCQGTRGGGDITVVSMTNEYDCRSTTTSTHVRDGGKYVAGDRFYKYAPRVILVRQETDPAPTHIPHEDDPYYVEPSHGLSGGTIAGIVVGSVVGGLIVICIALCCCGGCIRAFQKPKNPQQQEEETEGINLDPPPPYEATKDQNSTDPTPAGPSSSEAPEQSQALLSRG